MNAVAITGLGLVCALGASVREAWPRIMRGEHGIGPITRFDATAYPARLAAEVRAAELPPHNGGPGGVEPLRRGTRLFMAAAAEAWADAGLPDLTRRGAVEAGRAGAGPVDRGAGVAAGTSVNYLHMAQMRALWKHRDPSSDRVDLGRAAALGLVPRGSLLRRHGETMAAATAAALGIAGPRLAIDTACASGAHAISTAFRMVARGEAPLMVAGGGSGLIMPVTVLAFSRIGALTTNTNPDTASRPFDRRRDGFVLGEGAAAVVLEPLRAALTRGVRIYAELAGAATTVNAHTLTDPSPGGEAEAATIGLALADAAVEREQVDFVAAHGTSTPKNDVTETLAVKKALGRQAWSAAVSSHKGQLGHTLPAAGAVNVVLAAMALATQSVPPTAHLIDPDPECDLDYVPGAGRAAEVRVALAHAFAFGGQNVVIVLRGAATDQGLARLPVPGDEAAA